MKEKTFFDYVSDIRNKITHIEDTELDVGDVVALKHSNGKYRRVQIVEVYALYDKAMGVVKEDKFLYRFRDLEPKRSPTEKKAKALSPHPCTKIYPLAVLEREPRAPRPKLAKKPGGTH